MIIKHFNTLGSPKGSKESLQPLAKHRGVKLLTTVDYVTGQIVWQEDEQNVVETFLSFLKKVTAAYQPETS